MSIVRTNLDRVLWNAVHNNPEFKTTMFWEHKLNTWFSAKEQYAVASQQPPTDEPGSLRRVDLIVDKLTGELLMHRLFIFEAKKSNASQTEIQELEGQAYQACMAHLIYTGREYMYAMTVTGTLARLWIAHSDEPYLVPWIPKGANLADKSQYIEAHSTEGSRIEDGFKYMKKHDNMEKQRVEELREKVAKKVSAGGTQHSSSPELSSSPPQPALYDSRNLGSGVGSAAGTSPYKVIYSPFAGVSASSSTSAALPIRSVASTQGDDVQVEAEAEKWVKIPQPTLEVRRKKEDIVRWDYEGVHYEKYTTDFMEGQVYLDGAYYECYYITGKQSGIHFWVFDLRDIEPWSGKGKEKAR